jgi:integrase
MKLTQRAIEALALPASKTDAIWFDDQLPNFGVRLREGGSRMYVVQYKLGGKQRRITLGSTALLKADAARDMARDMLSRVRLGGDPAAEKIEAQVRAGETFAAKMQPFLVRQKARLRPGSYDAQERFLRAHFKPFHNLPLTRIDRRTIAGRLSDIATDKGPTAADRARAAISAFFTWAMKEGLVDSNPVIATNTHASGKGRDRVLSKAELVEVWNAAGGGDYGTVVKLLMLTGCRRAEIGSLRWDEIDFAARLIRLPGERAKNHRPHDVPLSNPALRLLQAIPRQRTFVFGDRGGIGFCRWSPGKAALDEHIAAARQSAGAEPMRPWVIHDIRRSVATHMAEIGIQPHIIEAVMNHVSGHKAGVAGVYNRAVYEREKRQALDLWAEHVMALVEGRVASVVQLRA